MISTCLSKTRLLSLRTLWHCDDHDVDDVDDDDDDGDDDDDDDDYYYYYY